VRPSEGRRVATIRLTDPPIVIAIRTGTNTIHAARPHMMTDAATVSTKPSHGASTPAGMRTRA